MNAGRGRITRMHCQLSDAQVTVGLPLLFTDLLVEREGSLVVVPSGI